MNETMRAKFKWMARLRRAAERGDEEAQAALASLLREVKGLLKLVVQAGI